MLYKIEKAGKVRVHGTPDSPCGSEKGGRLFEYVISVESHQLDQRHFVIEHLDINAAITKFFKENKITGSCEQVAREAGKIVSELLSLNNTFNPLITVEFRGTATITVVANASQYRLFSSIAAVKVADETTAPPRPEPVAVAADPKPVAIEEEEEEEEPVRSRSC